MTTEKMSVEQALECLEHSAGIVERQALATLRAELAGMKADAERYRHLQKIVLWSNAGQGDVRWTFWLKMNEPDMRKMMLREGSVAAELDTALDRAREVPREGE